MNEMKEGGRKTVDSRQRAAGGRQIATRASSGGDVRRAGLRDKARDGSPAPYRRLLSVYCLLPSALCLLLSPLLPPPHASRASAHDGAAEARLLEVGDHAPAKSGDEPSELKVVSYNIRYRAGDDLQRLAKLLKDDPEIGGAHVIGLQEVDRNKKRTGHVNTVRQLAEALGMRYAWAAPPDTDEDGEEETGCAILSPFPMTDVTRILLTHEGPDGRRRVAVGATLQVGKTPVRVYSVHAETRMPVAKKVEHWRAVLDDLRLHPKVAGVIVLGDFNTIKGKDVKAARRLFTEEGFTTPIPDDRSTWKTFVIKLKLDWLWMRGLEARTHGIDKEVGLSDHWPLWVTVKLAPRPEAKDAAAK